jgi:hypothetical protein
VRVLVPVVLSSGMSRLPMLFCGFGGHCRETLPNPEVPSTVQPWPLFGPPWQVPFWPMAPPLQVGQGRVWLMPWCTLAVSGMTMSRSPLAILALEIVTGDAYSFTTQTGAPPVERGRGAPNVSPLIVPEPVAPVPVQVESFVVSQFWRHTQRIDPSTTPWLCDIPVQPVSRSDCPATWRTAWLGPPWGFAGHAPALGLAGHEVAFAS